MFAGLVEYLDSVKARDPAARSKWEVFIYPGVNHGFHNDSTPRYDEAAAKLAWQRTIAFFKNKLA